MRARYRVWVDETNDTFGGDRVITVGGPSRVSISPDSRSQRTIGLVLGIAGPVIMMTGAVVMLSSLEFTCEGEGGGCSSRSDAGGAGFLMFLGGAAITPIGWVMFGKSFRPNMDVQLQREMMSRSTAAPRAGVIATPRGAGLGASMSF